MMAAVRWWVPAVAVLAIGAGACHRSGPATQPPPTSDEVAAAGEKGNAMTADPDVVKMLEDRDYQRLFMAMTDQAIDEVWARAGASGLDAVIADPKASSKARYLAAEIRFRKDPKYRPADPGSLARAYADALRTEVLANPWGMPGELDEPLGKHVVSLGEPAVEVLAGLLSDERSISYGGSKEATVGDEYQMRVKDFAAFFIASIRNRPLAFDMDPKVRDQAIAALRASL
jgi:hypothetical protein